MVHIDAYSVSVSAAPVPDSDPAPARPDPSSISPDAWRRLESAALGVLCKIHPTAHSEQLRASVIAYVQRLLGNRAGCQVVLSLPCLPTFPPRCYGFCFNCGPGCVLKA